MERLMWLGAVFALLVLAVPVRAQDDAFTRLKTAIEERAAKAERPVNLEYEQCTLVIAANKSANKQNGIPGQRIRESLRGMMNAFWVDGEPFRVVPFQLTVDPAREFTFKAAHRIELYDRVDTLCSSSGYHGGGSDVEQAKDAVLTSISETQGNAVGIVFTNHDRSQVPTTPPVGWEGLWVDRGLASRVEARAQQLNVEWGKYLIAKDTADGRPVYTWAHVVVRASPKEVPMLTGGRTAVVNTQNRDNPPVTKGARGGQAPAGDIQITVARRPERFKVYLEWTRPRQAPKGYAVILRRKGSPSPLNTFQSKEERYTVSLPNQPGTYTLTVAATDEQGKPTGREAPPVTVPVNAGGGPGDIPLMLLLGTVTLIMGIWLIRPVTVRVNERDPVTLWPWNHSFSVVTRGAATKGPRDLELDYTVPDLDHPTLAEIKRRTFGGVQVDVGKGRLATVEGGRSSDRLVLSKGHHQVTISKENGERLMDLYVQVGQRNGSSEA